MSRCLDPLQFAHPLAEEHLGLHRLGPPPAERHVRFGQHCVCGWDSPPGEVLPGPRAANREELLADGRTSLSIPGKGQGPGLCPCFKEWEFLEDGKGHLLCFTMHTRLVLLRGCPEGSAHCARFRPLAGSLLARPQIASD